MKKTVKRILCGALSLAMCSTLVLESVLRLCADGSSTVTTANADAAFTDVTGKYDTSALRESYFNSSVLKSEDTAPTYETRTVIIRLAGEAIIDRSGSMDVPSFVETWSGERARAAIATEQANFLNALSKKGISYELEHSYDTVINAVAVEMDTKYVSEVKKMKGVESVFISKTYAEPQTVDTATSGAHSDVVTNKTDVYDTGIYASKDFAHYGEGMVVAVLDTGLDYTHKAFQQFQSISEGSKTSVELGFTKDYVKSKLGDLVATTRSGELDVSEVYLSDKVPYAYDYADDDPDVYPSYSNHGTHVAGIIGGYDPTGYTDKDGNHINEKFLGVVPDAQLMICKVFTDDLDDPDLGGAVSADIVAALDDCVELGVDVINMSLGSSCGFTTTDDGDDEGEELNRVYNKVMEKGISLICAASNDYSAGYGGVYGTNLATNPDAGTVGSPSTFAAALSVASINGQKSSYFVANEDTSKKSYVFFEEARDINSNALDFVAELNEAYPNNNGKFEYVVVPGVGNTMNFNSVSHLLVDDNGNSRGRIALVQRGDTTFQAKVEAAKEAGAAGIIVYNNVAGVIRMNLGEVEEPIPAVSISMNAGTAMASGAKSRVGTLTIHENYAAGPFMSEFSSWGPTPDLRLKPEITAHGGEITSAVPGGYGEQSGTSMATPNMAGFMAIVRSYIEKELGGVVDVSDAVAVNRLAMQLTMSTAGTVYDQEGLPYSPRKQGAGVAKLENVVGGTKAYLYTNYKDEKGNVINDYRPKIELGDDKDKTGEYELKFSVKNFGTTPLTFKTDCDVMTETLSSDRLTVSEQAYMLNASKTAKWSVSKEGSISEGTITVPAGKDVEITVQLTLSASDKKYIDKSFENGMYVEGFAKLVSTTDGQCDLTIPFMGFYGDWEAAPMLDYSAYEVAENAQDASVLDEDKIKASVWATQPYNIYYNDKYVLPMGGYLYQLSEYDQENDPMYVDEEHNAVSRYNDYYGEGDSNNYMTSTGIKAVYAGLLRNARLVKYRLIDESTGEEIYASVIDRVSKAYAGGGSAVPANVKLELYPEEMGLLANGRYKMEFDFFREYDKSTDQNKEPDDTYQFSFTVDYEAPVMEDVRVRYYNYKEGKKDKQRIYLDVDVYDNHYAQTMMICYPRTEKDENGNIVSTVLQLATEYPTPIRKSVKNGVTTVSVEITDIYEQYGNQLYVQLDDYALNTCLYQVNIDKANANMLADGEGFALAKGEEALSLDIYEAHKVALVYEKGDTSNFLWSSSNEQVAKVKNGEIVGIGEGEATIYVSNRKGTTKSIEVVVSRKISEDLADEPRISFGIIQTNVDALQKAEDRVKVSAGKTFAMQIQTEPWYFPLENSDIVIQWSSSDPKIATVTDEGVVKTLKKGMAIITAAIYHKNEQGELKKGIYSATVYLRVQDDFTVSNYTLTKYSGLGGDVVIPTDLNVMYIGEEAFEDNDNIRSIVIPSSVVEIRPRAFMNCKALEAVYFVSKEAQQIADADVSMIYEQAFYGCKKLKLVDFTNVKTVTIAADCFGECKNLATVEGMTKIGTMFHRAFAGTALTSADIRGLHMSGESVFADCKKLTTIKTDKFTAIGKNMFKGCTALRNKVTLKTPKIGEGAFMDCVNLSGVVFDASNEVVEFDIGASAFENCGQKLRGNFTVDMSGANVRIRSIGARAFAGSRLKNVGHIRGLEVLGEKAFFDTLVEEIELYDDMIVGGEDLSALRLTGIPFESLTVTVATGATKYEAEGGIIYNKGRKKILYVNPAVRGDAEGKLTLPESVEEITEYAFAGSRIKELTLPSGLRVLGDGVFKNARITKVNFTGSLLEEIPYEAFAGSKVTGVTLPDSVKKIGDNAFAKSAVSAFVANGLTELGNNVFENCTSLQTIALADGIKKMGSYTFRGCTSLTDVALPSVEKMGVYTFLGATSLTTVTYGDRATTTGDYTFAGLLFTDNSNEKKGAPVERIDLSNNTGITELGEGLFYLGSSLKEVNLPANCVKIGLGSFDGCSSLTKVEGLENVTVISDYAFYNTKLPKLTLQKAKTIGVSAFERLTDTDSYTEIQMPVVERIGERAFFNGGMETVQLPASVKSIGAAAFASANNHKTITVAEENATFFVEKNVLYRYTDTDKKTIELVCYPTAYVSEAKNGVKTFTVKEGTARILAYAFYDLKKDALNAVVLPYSVKIIGDSAFFQSGIAIYSFESIQAPTLETSYRQEVRNTIATQSEIAEYKGYYNTNFETYLYHFTRYGGQTSSLTMQYPCNGSGYDNPVYTMYFGTRTASEKALIEDETRECVAIIKELPDADGVAAWADKLIADDDVDAVKAIGERIKTARIYYNNAVENEGQAGFVDGLGEKLLAVEEKFREVKKHFDIPFVISELRVADDSTHKSEYKSGETFDMSGLSVYAVYDDYSTEPIDASKLVLLTTEKLNKDSVLVEVEYQTSDGKIVLRIPITVTPSTEVTPDEDTEEKPEEVASAIEATDILIILAVVILIGGGAVAIVVVRKNKQEARVVRRKQLKLLRTFENEYGEIHTNVECVVYSDNVTPEEMATVQNKVSQFKNSLVSVNVPEGGKVKHNVKAIKK